MSQGLPIDRIVSVSINLSPPAPQAQNLNSCLIMGNSDVIDVQQRIRTYLSSADVATDFGTTAPEYLAAVLWFEQVPQPTSLLIGRWAQAATLGKLITGPVSAANQLVSAWTGITTGGFMALLDGAPYAIGPLNFSSVTNLNGVASTIQTALAAAVSGSTCVWDASYKVFRFTVGGAAGAASTFGFLQTSSAVGSAAFSGQPSANDTLTLNGTTITFVSGTPTGNQVQIGLSLSATMTALYNFLTASTDSQLVKFKYYLPSGSTTIYFAAATAGVVGNSLTLSKVSTNITVSGATLAGAQSTDVSGMLAGTSTSSGAYVANGVAAETAVNAVTTMDINFGMQWYGLSFASTAIVDADHLAIAAYIESATNKHYYGVTTQEGGVITQGDQTSIAYQLSQLKYNHTCVQYSSTNAYAVVSYLARILTTNWSGNNTTITLKFKQEPGIVAETLNATQVNAAEAVNANVFVNYNDSTAIIEQGVSCSGQYTDTIVGLDWLATEMQNNLYTAFYTSQTKIPMTDAGNHLLATIMANTLEEAVNNGLVAPGTWNTGGFGALNEGDYLKTGYYIYQPLVSSMTAADRAARKSVPFQIAINLGGAIHSANVAISVNT